MPAWGRLDAESLRDALAKIMQRAQTQEERELVAGQAAMIERLAAASVDEPADLADVRRACQTVMSPGRPV